MKNLIEDLKNQTLKNVYLLYGEEAYLKQLYKKKLMEAVLPEGDTMNLTIYEGKGIDPKEVIGQAETMPFFADHRLVLLENSGFCKNAAPELADYVPKLPPETVLVLVEEEVDKRSRLYKAIQKKGRVVEFARQDERTLTRWILGSVKKEQKQITEGAMQLFLEKAGNDMGNIQKELEKLFCYTYEKKEITASDVEAICTTQTTNKIFEMISAVAEKKQKRALELYYDLLALKEPPMRILFLIARQFNQLLQVKEMKSHGYDAGGIASRLGIAPFIVKNALRQSNYFSLEDLEAGVRECVELEEAVKTGRMNDQMSVELLLVQLSSKVK
ncbi:MAG: DNA polymerase III subunit delta [Eubacteriales bacterium]|nr:DNA polymerase III subunit delta [Eubacteriales bacterium]